MSHFSNCHQDLLTLIFHNLCYPDYLLILHRINRHWYKIALLNPNTWKYITLCNYNYKGIHNYKKTDLIHCLTESPLLIKNLHNLDWKLRDKSSAYQFQQILNSAKLTKLILDCADYPY